MILNGSVVDTTKHSEKRVTKESGVLRYPDFCHEIAGCDMLAHTITTFE